MSEIRAKEARAELYVDGVRKGGSFSTIYDISVKPDATIAKKRFTGEARARGDLDVVGQDVSFKTEKRDHLWSDLWNEIQEAEANGLDLPDVSIVLTYAYRGGGGAVKTVVLHGDPAMKMDDDSIPMSGYQVNTWTAFFSYATPG
jgi:hypothetical protein